MEGHHARYSELLLSQKEKTEIFARIDEITKSLNGFKRDLIHEFNKAIYTVAIIQYIIIIGFIWALLYYHQL